MASTPARTRTTGATVRRVASSVLLIALTTLTALLQVSVAGTQDFSSGLRTWAYLSTPVVFGAPWLLLLRHRYPLRVALITAVLPVVTLVDPLLPLVALTGLVGRSRSKAVWYASALTCATTIGSVVRDTRLPAQGSALKWLLLTVEHDDAAVVRDVTVPLWVAVLLGLVATLVAIGIGLYLRTRIDLADAKVSTRQSRAEAQGLRADLARQYERDLVAREAHDTLAHRISLLALHAGALEMTSQRSAQEGGPDIEAQASVVREQAQAALGDVRGLIELLRDPYQGTAEHFMDDDSTIGLAQLPQLIDECREAGMTLSTTVWINEAMPIPATVSRATYRVVQEALTNARRHAAGLPVDLEVRVGRPAGVSITVANPLPGGAVDLDGATAAPPEVTGPGRAAHDQGRGLAGIAERARLLGGTSECGPTADGRFVVAVDLPFQTSATD